MEDGKFSAAQRNPSMVIAVVVCPSIRLSQVNALLRHLNLGLCKKCPGDFSLLVPKIWAKFRWDHAMRERQIEMR